MHPYSIFPVKKRPWSLILSNTGIRRGPFESLLGTLKSSNISKKYYPLYHSAFLFAVGLAILSPLSPKNKFHTSNRDPRDLFISIIASFSQERLQTVNDLHITIFAPVTIVHLIDQNNQMSNSDTLGQ